MSQQDKIIRIQANKLNVALNMPINTYIPNDDIKAISMANVGETIIVKGHKVLITMSIKGIAQILLSKINN